MGVNSKREHEECLFCDDLVFVLAILSLAIGIDVCWVESAAICKYYLSLLLRAIFKLDQPVLA